MKKTPVIDANIILRFLTNDDPMKADACTKLLEGAERNECHVWLPDLVLADVIWTLEKFYRLDKLQISKLVAPIISLRGLCCSNKETIFQALNLYTHHNIDWTDAFVAAQMTANNVAIIYSYDRDYDKVHSIKRKEP